MNLELKSAIDQLFDVCDLDGVKAGEDKSVTSLERENLKKEFINFLSYLSASDGTISSLEAQFISEYFGQYFSAQGLRSYIDTNQTYTSKFETTVPTSLKSLVSRDNHAFEKNGEIQASYSEAYISVFECLGKEFLACDGQIHQQEIDDFTIYTSTLRNYKRDNGKFSEQVISAIDISGINPGQNIPVFNEEDGREESLESLIKELNDLVGLEMVKNDVNSLIHLQEVKKIRRARGLKEIPVSNHLVFYGNPGTGKTTVARLLAKIYHAMGILSKGQFVEVDRSGLVAGYVGQTALKVKEVVDRSIGGVLFIDEAYSLTYSQNGSDYGQEAVDALIKSMEDNREDLIVIVAGYPELMARFIDSNPGLRSRFNKYINFEDYDSEELAAIFRAICKKYGYAPTDAVIKHVAEVFDEKYSHREDNFANAREVRNYFEKAMMNQADRLFLMSNPTNEELCTLELEDVIGIH